MSNNSAHEQSYPGVSEGAEHNSVAEQIQAFPVLPEGYAYDPHEDIDDKDELAELLGKTGAFEELSGEELEAFGNAMEDHGIAQRGIGIRAANGELAGYGLVAHTSAHAEFATFAVDPSHQGRGLGKAIIDASLCFTDQHDIQNIAMPPLLPTNTLKSYYIERGFRQTKDGSIVRGPDPKTVERLMGEAR